ncbi:branched-chain amino acid ABC transporter substrate-binding protein [Alloalcanivorax xenomutans]|jgi:branched-chain amino acid transport system substrate-binding protein|uniref:branched-chain amino acid ABC transporter substrate-binding protein n=1 Tax=Alloalcanivorax xenomutans TaxID=1094342 RepID=UPI0003B85C82|nr:branched-chain amino acid ABC transporter substrate-binding protein [Alloalcanivorax xenomutans]ERS15043.1 branched-chain amino acid ABC transporter substrate-binding protein [Alcanivorax sp. PN-3]MBA4722128.1 branched-chain amino acid ABC transporter substrate-binding protein [Alcanivorax sp.]PHS72052.1 MAG: branched-chain amino acid ABC transporter substrate-binding protein [Alcanivorax sp.]CUR48298.1 Branched-chain amino acid ABC transporter, amino acid-binding protein (TC 3.A.1.4.1) [All
MLKSVRTLVTASLLLAGTAASAAETVKLALIDPLTGPMAAAGQPAFEHLKLEAERINANGGLNGAKLEIVGLDNKVNPQESLVQLQKAINDGIQLVTQGNGSSVASALITSVEKHNRRNPGKEVLYLNYAAVDPAFTNERCSYWHFRFDANADMKMNALTNYIASNKDIHKVYLINQDYSFGHAVSKSAQEMLKQKRPDIEIVGNDFHPLAKVKDFTPYVSKIQASGADAVISGNWGQDITLLVKAAAEFGLKAPFYTYYGASSGVVTQLGDKGVDRIYQINEYYGDFEDPEMAKKQVEMYEKTGWDFYYLRLSTMLDMLKAAADKAGSTDPKDLAKALEGLSIETPTGEVTMRAEDHQIQLPMFISVMKDGMKYGAEGTDYNFHKIAEIARDDVTLPTTCRMRRPN